MTDSIFSRLFMLIRERPLRILLWGCVGVFSLHLLTLAEYPATWFDEVEILEMGRFSIFDRNPEWSVNLFPTTEGPWKAPSPYFHYLAGLLLEGLYRLSGGFLLGRFAMLLSLPCCACALFFWLRSKKFSPGISLLTSFLLLVDPNATICAHWYRPDLWCMTFTFSVLVLLAGKSRPFGRYFLSGILMAMSIVFWITSILFLPLVFLEVMAKQKETCPDGFVRNALGPALVVALGLLLGTIIFLAPLCAHVHEIIKQYSYGEIGALAQVAVNIGDKVLSHASAFVKIMCRSPIAWFLAWVGLLYGRQFALHRLLFLALVGFVVVTNVYHLRMIYLMPYVFLLVAETLRLIQEKGQKLIHIGTLLCVLAICWGCGISLGALTFAAWPESNTLALLTSQLSFAFPQSAPKVYVYDAEHETYYAGRRLGWRMYSYNGSRHWIFQEPHAQNLSDMDGVVVSAMQSPLTDEQKDILTRHGFIKNAEVVMPPAATGGLKSRLASVFYAHGYPNYEIWKKR